MCSARSASASSSLSFHAPPSLPHAYRLSDSPLSQEENRATKKKGKRGNTTAKQYNSAYSKWFTSFCTYAKWNVEERLDWLDELGNVSSRGQGILRRFFAYMHAHPGMTWSPFKNAIYWAQHELNVQRRKLGLADLDEYVTSLPGVKELKQEVAAGRRTIRLEAMLDLQASIESEITEEQMLAICAACLSGQTDETSWLVNLQMNHECAAPPAPLVDHPLVDHPRPSNHRGPLCDSMACPPDPVAPSRGCAPDQNRSLEREPHPLPLLCHRSPSHPPHA